MIKVTDVAYARFRAPDLDLMESFLKDFGLTRSFRTETALYMRGTDSDHHLHITELGQPEFLGFAFNAASEEDLHIISKVEGASSVEKVYDPGGGKRVTLTDPDGFLIEIVHGMDELPELPVINQFSPNFGEIRNRQGKFVRLNFAPAQCKRLGHVVLNVTNFKATDEFYKSHFGLITSDECFNDAGEICLAFNRVDRGKEYVDHHTLLTIPSPQAGLGHIAFEVQDINHIFLGHEFLKNNGHRHSWGIGRHILGSQVFDYWFDPFGFRVEHWTDGDLLNADTPVGRSSAAEALNVQWGADSSQRAT